jgi:hypothetical protein
MTYFEKRISIWRAFGARWRTKLNRKSLGQTPTPHLHHVQVVAQALFRKRYTPALARQFTEFGGAEKLTRVS